mgnify:CR=1 FL=1
MGTGTNGEVSLDELNKLIAKERGVKVSELAVADPTPNQTADEVKTKTTKKPLNPSSVKQMELMRLRVQHPSH